MSTGLSRRSNSASNGLKSKPLQQATNIIHTKIHKSAEHDDRILKPGLEALQPSRSSQPAKPAPKGLSLRNKNKDNKILIEPKLSHNVITNKLSGSATKKAGENKSVGNVIRNKDASTTSSIKPNLKVDENDVSAFVKNAYNPLDDIYPLDEELYQKVLKLELADDGLPGFELGEPFDF